MFYSEVPSILSGSPGAPIARASIGGREMPVVRQGLSSCVFLALMTMCCAGLAETRGRCEELRQLRLPDVELSRSRSIGERDDLPAFCEVEGRIVKRVRFVLRMPATDWNGKFVVAGCGGFCGSLNPDKPGYSNSINGALRLGFAAIQTDGGHEAESWDTDWAIGDREALSLYAGQWMPLAVEAGRTLLQSFYGPAPRRVYFSGCSNGGRLGMYAAQRYPQLFDGIAAGGGIFDLTGNSGIHGLWLLQSTRDARGHAVIDRDKLPLLAAQVMAQCDDLDGVNDDVVSRPERCAPQLDTLACDGPEGQTCFTIAEIAAIRRLYQGATANGEPLFPGIPPGSESLWSTWIVGTDAQPAWGERAAEGYLRLAYGIPTAAAFHPHDYVLADEVDRLKQLAPVLDATDPDLRAFADAGGKLFYYHGLADPLILEGRVREYYRDAVAVTGETALTATARFFMVPGHGHCWEKPGQVADDFDPLVVIDRWVESAEAPDRVIAGYRGSGPERSQILCPYPQVADAKVGSPGKAAEYRCEETWTQ